MTNSCYDPLDNPNATSGPADPFRRRLLSAAILTTGGALAAGIPLAALAANTGRAAGALGELLAVPLATADAVRVSADHAVSLLYAWGDPVSTGPAARTDATDNARAQEQQAGMHPDGMHFFPFVDHGKPSSTHGLMCINHEYTDDGLLHADGMQDWSLEKVAKSQA